MADCVARYRGLQFGHQRLGTSKFERIEPLSEPAIHRSHQRQRFCPSSTAGPKLGKRQGYAQLPEFRLLTAGDLKRFDETALGARDIGSGRASNASAIRRRISAR